MHESPDRETPTQVAASGGGVDPGDDDIAPPSGGSCYITVYYDDYGYIYAAEDPYGCLNG